jgi:hypothetical protein
MNIFFIKDLIFFEKNLNVVEKKNVLKILNLRPSVFSIWGMNPGFPSFDLVLQLIVYVLPCFPQNLIGQHYCVITTRPFLSIVAVK